MQPPCVSDDTEIVVVLGGDGTILRAAELVHCTQVPILGVNMGHVGFLAEFESFQIDEAIRRIATHDYSIDERMIAHVDVRLPGATKPIEDWALNDITRNAPTGARWSNCPSRGRCGDELVRRGRRHRLHATGSTAYAFSAAVGHVAERQGPAVDSVGRARPVRQAATTRLRLDLHHLDILDDSMSEGWICCDGRRQRALPQVRASWCANDLAPRPTLRRAVHQPSGLQVRSARGRLAQHARNEASSQSLHRRAHVPGGRVRRRDGELR